MSELTEQQKQKRYQYIVAESKNIKLTKQEDGSDKVTVPVQSTRMDRDGDVINEAGQDILIEQYKTGKVPAFPNHGIGDYDAMYDFRDIMGKWVDGFKENGITYGVLQLRKNNQAAEQLKDLVEQDMPVGFSIGFIIRGCDEDEEREGLTINDLELLETSPVGIPSNAAAVHGNAMAMAKAAKSVIESKGNYADIKKELSKYGDNMTEENKNKDLEQEVTEPTDQEPTQDTDSQPTEEEKDYSIKEVSKMFEGIDAKLDNIEKMLKEQTDNQEKTGEDEEEEKEEESVNTEDPKNADDPVEPTDTDDTEEPKDATDTVVAKDTEDAVETEVKPKAKIQPKTINTPSTEEAETETEKDNNKLPDDYDMAGYDYKI